jgi:NAD(P)-dependent dehydrogenase (short-subunit alcohol dehydrogenase family)
MAQLDGRVAIVTGAAVGIGNAIARAFAAAGARLALCDVREEVRDLARELGAGAVAEIADVSQPADVQRVVEAALRAFGRIDVLVNNAGVWGASLPGDSLEKTLRDYDALVGTNLKGSFLFGRAVIPHLVAQGSGDIVNVCTDHVQTCGSPFELTHDDAPGCPFAGQPPRPTGGGPAMDLYDASKWGQLGLTLAWARALAPHGIRVNALCMGATDSFMLRSFHKHAPPPEEVARWMKPADLARLTLELLRDGRSGETIGVAVGHPVALPPRRANPYLMTAPEARR